jgi:hypothetical protein
MTDKRQIRKLAGSGKWPDRDQLTDFPKEIYFFYRKERD